MFEKIIAKKALKKLLGRPDITKAYEMKGPEDSWYHTLKKVHESLAEIHAREHEIWEMTSFDNVTLRAVHYPCTEVTPKGTVVFVHGYTSHAERESAFPCLFYLSLGYNVVIPYQRAHGLSEGEMITFGALERRDMLDWLAKIETTYGNLPIVVHGLSMGGGIALQLCDSDVQNLKAIVADAPSESIEGLFRAVSRDISRKKSQKLFECLCQAFESKCGCPVSDTDIVKHIERTNCPVFFVAGSKENAKERLEGYQKICPKTSTVVILPGCNHGNGMYKQTQLYQSSLKDFFAEHVS